MATSLAIKRRIKSVNSIKQVTKTMQIVSASRMKKVQDSAHKLKPYAENLTSILNELSSKIGETTNPFFVQKEGKNLLVVISPTRGLDGALPSALMTKVFKWSKENEASYISVNKIGFRALKKQRFDVISFYDNISYKASLSTLEPIIEEIKELYLEKGFTTVYFAYPKFISTLKQEIVIEKLLPIEKAVANEDESGEFKLEPSREALLETLVPHYIEMKLYDAIINNSASEESARMIAMKNATDNAKEMINDLVLSFNKARQLKITQQVAEISAAL